MSAKLEINVRSLIAHCEELINDQSQRWRLNKYIKSLDTMINELDEYDTVDRKNLGEYQHRLREIKNAVDYKEPPEKLGRTKLSKTDSTGSMGDTVIREIKQLRDAKYTTELRKELFDGDDSTGLRKRGANESNENMESYYTNIQEKLADEMLNLTRNLKEQTLTANKIIKNDTEVVGSSVKKTTLNQLSLEKESKKLDEHNKRAWKCWMWVMIAFVMMIFIFMVLFMKIMKKRSY